MSKPAPYRNILMTAIDWDSPNRDNIKPIYAITKANIIVILRPKH